MNERKPYDVLEVMEGSPRLQSVSMADFCCEQHALLALDRAWGVRIHVGLVLTEKKMAFNRLAILVRCQHLVHERELNDWPGVILEALDPELAPWSIQIVSALYVAAVSIEQHMRR